MGHVHINLFSPKEMKIVDDYKHQYGISTDSISITNESDVIEAILSKMPKTRDIYTFRANLLGAINESAEYLFDDLTTADCLLNNQIIMEKHISITLIAAIFCHSICEHCTNECTSKLCKDQELIKAITVPSAKLCLMPNASLQIREQQQNLETKLQNAFLELYRNESVIKNELEDGIENIKKQLNEVITFFATSTMLNLSQFSTWSKADTLSRTTVFIKELLSNYLNEIYLKIKLCHEIAKVNRELHEMAPLEMALKKSKNNHKGEWITMKTELLKRKKQFRSANMLLFELFEEHQMVLVNKHEMEFFNEMCSLTMFLVTKKCIKLIRARINLENLRDNYYANVVDLIFDNQTIEENILSQKIMLISSKIRALKIMPSHNKADISALSIELKLLAGDLLKEIDEQTTSLKLLQPSNKSELQKRDLINSFLSEMRSELTRGLK